MKFESNVKTNLNCFFSVSKPGAVPPGSMVSNLAKSTPSLFKSQSVNNNNNNKPVCDKGETRKGLFKSSLESLQQRQSLHEGGSGSDHGVNSPSRGTQQTPFHNTNPQQSSAMQPPSANSHHTQVKIVMPMNLALVEVDLQNIQSKSIVLISNYCEFPLHLNQNHID